MDANCTDRRRWTFVHDLDGNLIELIGPSE